MKIPYQVPSPAGLQRAEAAQQFRILASETARKRPHALTQANGEEVDFVTTNDSDPCYPANFTKGLYHNRNGLVDSAADYRCFVEAINSDDRTLFEKHVNTAETRVALFKCYYSKPAAWRGWESPRAGHVYELEGPDPGAVAMAPAPRVGSSELSAEMAEVYALALLRDVSFAEIESGGDTKISGGKSALSSQKIVDELNCMAFFSGDKVVSSTPGNVGSCGLNKWEKRRQRARTQEQIFTPLTTRSLFRGSAKGVLTGPYISQFLLAGNETLSSTNTLDPRFAGTDSSFNAADGFIVYGNQIIDQRVLVHKVGLDYMSDWTEWLDVQNGANFSGNNQFEPTRRFITTPRDLATYVHFDSLYQAYLNAALMLIRLNSEKSAGFPEPSPSGRRTPFATFGGPHILSLVTEVATRCLKSVRRQKFNYHRRARPEALGGRLALVGASKYKQANEEANPAEPAVSQHEIALGVAAKAFDALHEDIPECIRAAIVEHNKDQNGEDMSDMRGLECNETVLPDELDEQCLENANLLLPMAFAEGSPMHPAYGAGHATVAGGCVTMLKAFFEMFDSSVEGGEKLLEVGESKYYVPTDDGSALVGRNDQSLSIQGELNKLAANISIGRNMAGVHYYSDYYDSLRMGERIAVGILMEQAPTYGEDMEMSFDSFDGDRIVISSNATESVASISILDANGEVVLPDDWWLRHTSGQVSV